MRFKLFSVILGIVLVLPAAVPAQKGKDKADPDKGKELFDQCSVCHNPDSEEKKLGPGLKGLYKKAKMTNGKKPTDANVREVIDAGGNGMPPYKEMLTDEEKEHLIAYLKTL